MQIPNIHLTAGANSCLGPKVPVMAVIQKELCSGLISQSAWERHPSQNQHQHGQYYCGLCREAKEWMQVSCLWLALQKRLVQMLGVMSRVASLLACQGQILTFPYRQAASSPRSAPLEWWMGSGITQLKVFQHQAPCKKITPISGAINPALPTNHANNLQSI